MPEEIDGKQIFSLLEVTKSIQKTLAMRYKSAYWIKAEMNKLNFYQHSGHCYPDLVEKKDGQVIAQMRANLWKDDYERVNANFQSILKEPLKDGIKILFSATIGFHPQYGMSLRIIDIDPSYTLGDLEQEKQETIRKLREAHIFASNKALKFPMLPQRIAVISVETSNGYADFLKVLDSARATWEYSFFHLLFPSLLQGDNAAKTLVNQLKRIKRVAHHFDVVAIVRGGGGDIGLSCYNDFQLAEEIARFPIPVLTGIGHATNETVAEMVAYENAITPTKLAEMLIQQFHNFSVPVRKAEEKIIDQSKRIVVEAKAKFSSEVKLLRSATRNVLDQNDHRIRQQVQGLFQESRFRVIREKESLSATRKGIKKGANQFYAAERHTLSQAVASLTKDAVAHVKQAAFLMMTTEKNLTNLRPENVLKRGYSITRLEGKSIRSFDQVKEGDILDTTLHDGRVLSTVKSASKPSIDE